MIDCRYERESGELIVWLDTPAISKPKKRSLYKAVIWLTAYRVENKKVCYLVRHRKFDVFDITPQPQRTEKRYSGVEHSYKAFGYKSVKFSSLPYLRIHIGSQIIMTPNELTAPIESSGNWKTYWLLNSREYTRFDDLIKADYL